MSFPKCTAAGFAAALLLSACNTMWPSLDAPEPAETGTGTGTTSAAGTSSVDTLSVTPGAPTGTAVGARVNELRGQLERLQSQVGVHNSELQDLQTRVTADTEAYHGTVAAISARLQIGTTPGNPILVQQFHKAEADLDRIAADLVALNQLATSVAADASLAAYLSESTRATFGLSGAVDEDHRQLAVLQDETDRTAVLIDRLLTELSTDIQRQSAYVAVERGNLNALASGIRTGGLLGGSVAATPGVIDVVDVSVTESARRSTSRKQRPLVVIRFDQPTVAYQSSLYGAISQALERRPGATFDLIAVAPAGNDPGRVALDTTKARRHADDVYRSMLDMGLEPQRVAVSTAVADDARVNEVRLYIR